jgi:hypothetical protein
MSLIKVIFFILVARAVPARVKAIPTLLVIFNIFSLCIGTKMFKKRKNPKYECLKKASVVMMILHILEMILMFVGIIVGIMMVARFAHKEMYMQNHSKKFNERWLQYFDQNDQFEKPIGNDEMIDRDYDQDTTNEENPNLGDYKNWEHHQIEDEGERHHHHGEEGEHHHHHHGEEEEHHHHHHDMRPDEDRYFDSYEDYSSESSGDGDSEWKHDSEYNDKDYYDFKYEGKKKHHYRHHHHHHHGFIPVIPCMILFGFLIWQLHADCVLLKCAKYEITRINTRNVENPPTDDEDEPKYKGKPERVYVEFQDIEKKSTSNRQNDSEIQELKKNSPNPNFINC